jgi:hypothetical protein
MVCWAQEQSIPSETHFEQGIAVLRTVLAATLTSSWAIWLGAGQKRGLAMTLLRTGFPTQLALTLNAIAGWRSPASLNLIFPSTFFSEYNWLTFILEVAPITTVRASLLLFLSFRWDPRVDM